MITRQHTGLLHRLVRRVSGVDTPAVEPAYVPELAARLRERIAGEVRFDRGSRALYATDASNYRQVPLGVVLPKSTDDVIATVDACREFDAPLLARGGGTSLAGQCCNVAVVIDLSKYLRRILALDPLGARARVEPGCVLDTLRDAAERHHLTFAPDPSTHNHNTLGGMIGNNSCGVHSVMGGKTVDNVERLDVLTYGGLRLTVGPTSLAELEAIRHAGGRQAEIYASLEALRDRYAAKIRSRYPKIPRRVSGYNLDQLLPENGFHVARALVGSEGTCVTVLEATLRLVKSPRARSLVVLGYADVYIAGDHVPEILAHGPIGLEGLDDGLIGDMKRAGLHPGDIELLPPGGGWLLVEFGADSKEESDARARALMRALKHAHAPPTMKLFDDPKQEQQIWAVRESGLGATAHVPGWKLAHPGWEDAAVPPERLGAYLRQFRKLLDDYEYRADLYGHFGDGCVHTRIDFDFRSESGIATYRRFINEAASLVVRHGGSLSGEHGDGQSRAALLEKMYGRDLVRAFAEFKTIWDPAGRMNPGKLVVPDPPTDNLRLGPNYRPEPHSTYFGYADDQGDFRRAMLRCVGVGICRRELGGTMCPSYQATQEEQHSTRGRARLLFEMLRGDMVADGWRSDIVRASLDLCLSCKGCKNDCPVHVDMATYKAEFLAHYYRGRLRPRAAYSMGRIAEWSALASRMPTLANHLARAGWSAPLLKSIAGIAPDRMLPRFATETFRAAFARRRRAADIHTRRVLLWPDTFVEHFDPAIGLAAVEVLEHAGCDVVLPRRRLCCGRPLYDFGWLDAARRCWRDILDTLAPEIEAGTAVIGLEPACVSAFRDELVSLCDGDRARQLASNTFTLAEFLHRISYSPPPLAGRVLVHFHCHQRAVLGVDADERLLHTLGVDYCVPSLGCCGMAGSFGFERDKAALSRRIGELTVLPAARAADMSTLILADGFSCREQLRQCAGRESLHSAQLLQRALHVGDAG